MARPTHGAVERPVRRCGQVRRAGHDEAHAIPAFRDGQPAVTSATGPDEPSLGGADFDMFIRFVSPKAYLTSS